MSRLQRITWIVCFTAIAVLNVIGALPHIYFTWGESANAGDVQVYDANSGTGGARVAVQSWGGAGPNDPNGTFADTGQKVNVVIRHDFKDNAASFYPRLTLVILASGLVLHLVERVRCPSTRRAESAS